MKLAVRLPLLLAGSVMAASVAFAGWVHVTMEGLTGASAEQEALHQLAVAHRALDITGGPVAFRVLNDPAVPAPLGRVVASGQHGTYRLAEPPVVWAAEPADGGVLAVQASWEPWRAQQRALDANLIGGVLGLGAATAAASVLFSRRLGRRLQAAEDAAARIAAGELEVRVSDVVSCGDDVSSLAGTIDALAASMQERLESEKRVTADIAHDLRTPVTAM